MKELPPVDPEAFANKLRASETTKRLYSGKIRQYKIWLEDCRNNRKPCQNTAQEYIDYLETQGKKPNTIATSANALRKYFRTMHKIDISLHAPKIKIGEPKYRTMDEIYELLRSTIYPLEKCLTTVLFDSGCRISEVLNLKVDDIDWEKGFIRIVGKGGYIEDVNVSEKALDTIRLWLESRTENSKRVFMDYNYDHARKILIDVAVRAGIKNFSPHQLRHSRAVQMREQGADLHDVQMHLRHKNIGTTANIYGRLRPQDLKSKIPNW